MSRTYWRSLAQIDDLPEYRAALEREFPVGASELPEGITRRDMMLLLGASLSLAGMAGCRRPVEEIVPYVAAPEDVVPGVPRYYATTMPFGRSAYGLIVESHEGRPTKVEGNPAHPSTRGASSLRIQASVLGLYDPDRSQALALKGARKSWAEFVTAWEALSKAHLADGGAGLAVLAGSFSSPTLARLASDLRTRFPRLQWATYDAVSDEHRLAGLRQATGRDVDLMLRLDRAAVILSLDADPLLGDPEMIRHARGFADGRRAGASGGTMNRLYAVEGVYSLTGAMADHRLRLESRQIAAFVAALAARLGAPGASQGTATVPGVEPRWIDAVAKDLMANRGAGLIVAGERQPASVHAAVCALNAHLGNTGKTVSYYETKDAALPTLDSLTSLVTAMNAGTVQTLVILGGNPVFDAPADLGFAAAMAKVPHAIALAHTVDETSAAAEWHIPHAHYLESWGDARAVGGTLSIVQPLILPLFGGRTAVEVLGLMIADKDRPGYDIVRDTWKAILGEAEFDQKWNRVLHDGLLTGSELPEVVPTPGAEAVAALGSAPTPASGVEIVFVASPSLHDGRFANDGWLQELPDPLTKLTWDNPALVSPKTAETFGVVNEEMIRLDYAGRSLELPVWILPGMADNVVALTLGYGRRRAGRVGSGVGFDTFTVRTSGAPGFGAGAAVARLGRSYSLSATQDHGSMEGRPLVRESTLAELHAEKSEEAGPGALGVFEAEPEHFSLWKEHTYDKGHQWGMTIDLNACIGCNACMVACQSENNVPVVGKVQVKRQREMHWIRLDRYFSGDPAGNPEVVFQPVPCMQCEDAPCEQVCPVAATVHDQEGLNVMVYNRCIGTRYCSNNCPYKVRRFNFFNFTKDTPDILKLAMNPDVTVRARGVMEKCSYCTQRIVRAKIDAKLGDRELRDGDVRTACQQACPAAAIEFGDIRDQASRVAKAKADPRNYALLEELNTRPRTTYLAKVRNPNPELEAARTEAALGPASSDERPVA
ncbi:MAG TPA: TAT-variant-translocated molybdopterin oxidoreductase [Vicinamibacterales bacterium]|nr:TAT-variant-translocated molybdopterin oxidoreductase [Vicinamibacterales bacterium]